MNTNLDRVVSLVNRLKGEKFDYANQMYMHGMDSTEAHLVASREYGKKLALAMYDEAKKLDALDEQINGMPSVSGLTFVLIEDDKLGPVWCGMDGDELCALFVRGLDLVEYMPQSTLSAFESLALAQQFSDSVESLNEALIDGRIGVVTHRQQMRQMRRAA